jgi:UDP-N-acetylglucosamine enolpyruvyl transferase
MSLTQTLGGYLLIAALSAKGTSTIQNIEQIDRGYERIDERPRAIGANIVRVGYNITTSNDE